MGDPVGAEHGYYDYMEVSRAGLSPESPELSSSLLSLHHIHFVRSSQVPQFEKTEEARACWELLDAYQQCDLEALKKTVGRGVFTGLEQVFIKLAKKLPIGDFARQAAALNAARGGGPSADAAGLDDGDLT